MITLAGTPSVNQMLFLALTADSSLECQSMPEPPHFRQTPSRHKRAVLFESVNDYLRCHQGESLTQRNLRLGWRKKDYFVDRDLEKHNTFTVLTDFGPIDENIADAIRRKKQSSDLPVRVLTIGAGDGILEAELKRLFAQDVEISHLSLDPVKIQNRFAFAQEIIGNLRSTEILGAPYDRIISVYGSSHVKMNHQLAVIQKIVDALEVGGEAFFMLPCDLVNATPQGLLFYNSRRILRSILARHGITFSANPSVHSNMAANCYLRRECVGSINIAALASDVVEIDRVLRRNPKQDVPENRIFYRLQNHDDPTYLDHPVDAEETFGGELDRFAAEHNIRFVSANDREGQLLSCAMLCVTQGLSFAGALRAHFCGQLSHDR